ncbi:restriction endonuclease subunit S [Campylobacter upsaliensis]|uniref:restriction endonuclease subunit S n=1 Tax=Campylobacter upsaliensis TaxID=28080 RepID=UPI0022EA949E|nr:restriction endonuclease subunit S [Campylobacter upsaliensis]
MSEIFTRKFSEISGGSFQPEAYHYERLEIIEKLQKLYKNNLSKLSHIANIISQKSNAKNVKKYVGMANIESHTGIYIESMEDKGQGDCNIFKKGDVLFGKLRPYLNKVYFAEFEGGCSTEFIVLNSKDSNKISNRFLSIFLMLDCVVRQTKHLMTGNTLPRLQTSDIENLLIPLPPLSTQQHIIDLMDKTYKAKQEKENKAKELLDSIDSYLLEELGIILPLRANNTLDSRIYTAKISALSGSRFDANYHQPYYKKFEQALESGKYKTLRLVDICQFRRGSFPQPYGNQEWYGGANAMPFVQVADIDDNFELKEKTNQQISQLAQPKSVFVPQNTIILSIQGTIGRVAITQYDCYVDRTIAIFTELSNLLNQHFLAYMLSILFKNKADTARGITLKTITKEEFRNFKIPLPPLTEQERIAKEISQRKARAKALKQEAKESLESAKKEVEHIILGVFER